MGSIWSLINVSLTCTSTLPVAIVANKQMDRVILTENTLQWMLDCCTIYYCIDNNRQIKSSLSKWNERCVICYQGNRMGCKHIIYALTCQRKTMIFFVSVIRFVIIQINAVNLVVIFTYVLCSVFFNILWVTGSDINKRCV